MESYPLKRVGLSTLIDGGDDDIGLCDACSILAGCPYTSVECLRLRHEAAENVVLNVARVMPAIGPMETTALLR